MDADKAEVFGPKTKARVVAVSADPSSQQEDSGSAPPSFSARHDQTLSSSLLSPVLAGCTEETDSLAGSPGPRQATLAFADGALRVSKVNGFNLLVRTCIIELELRS